MASPIGQGFDAIGTRPGANGQTEYYNTQSGVGFENPNVLAQFVNTQYGQNTNQNDVFNTLAQGYTPRDTALSQIKSDLNSFQNDTFNSGAAAGKRASSSITDQVAAEQGNYDANLKEYNDLKTKLQALKDPNYQATYNDLTAQQGIPQINTDLANTDKTIHELPYVNRQNTGNAGVATEGQLGADTAQKGIPLEIQQANLIDRLKLAQDFVNNSLKFKEMDTNQSRQSLSDGLQAALETINLSSGHLKDLQTQQAALQADQQKAQQFAFDNRVTQPFYEIGGTVFRTSDQRAAHNPQEYVAMGGTGDFKDVQKLTKLATPVEVNPGNNLVDPNTGKVIYSAPYTPSQAANAIGGNSETINIPQNTLAARNNNPGNLRFAGQAGATQGEGGFAKFSTPEAGYQALVSQVQLDAGRGVTLSQFISKYAPPSENNTSQYLQQAITALGGSANNKLSSYDTNAVAQFMAKKESGTTLKTASGSAKTATSTNVKYTPSTATSEIMSEWKQGYLQGNGTISSSDYEKGKQWWTSNGLSVASFDKQFGYLIDKSSKNWKSDYGYGAN